MALQCPSGWQRVSAPSTPADLSLDLADYSPFLSSIVYSRRRRLGLYEWVPAEGVLPVQGNCGEQFVFTGGFTVETSSAHSINVGTLFNLPGTGEAVEISGGYEYTWGSAQGAGSGLEVTEGPTPCWEYLAQPVVLKFTVCIAWERDGAPWWEWLAWAMDRGYMIAPGARVAGVVREQPLFLRGGLMVCRRWCCEGSPPADHH